MHVHLGDSVCTTYKAKSIVYWSSNRPHYNVSDKWTAECRSLHIEVTMVKIIRLAYYFSWRRNLSHMQFHLLPDFLGFLEGTGPSPSRPRPSWTVPTSLTRSQPSLVLLSMQEVNYTCSACGHPLQDLASNSPPFGLSRNWASPARYLWHYFFHFWSLVQTLGRRSTVGSPWSSSTPSSLGRGRVVPPPPPW